MDKARSFDVVVQRPFQAVMIKPKTPRGRPRRAMKLNIDRVVYGGGKYHLLWIPYSKAEKFHARPVKTLLVKPMLPNEPGVEGVDYSARPELIEYEKHGHMQFVGVDRVDVAAEESPWAG